MQAVQPGLGARRAVATDEAVKPIGAEKSGVHPIGLGMQP